MPDTGDIGNGSGHTWVKPVIPRIMIRFEIYRTQTELKNTAYSQRGSITFYFLVIIAVLDLFRAIAFLYDLIKHSINDINVNSAT